MDIMPDFGSEIAGPPKPAAAPKPKGGKLLWPGEEGFEPWPKEHCDNLPMAENLQYSRAFKEWKFNQKEKEEKENPKPKEAEIFKILAAEIVNKMSIPEQIAYKAKARAHA